MTEIQRRERFEIYCPATGRIYPVAVSIVAALDLPISPEQLDEDIAQGVILGMPGAVWLKPTVELVEADDGGVFYELDLTGENYLELESNHDECTTTSELGKPESEPESNS